MEPKNDDPVTGRNRPPQTEKEMLDAAMQWTVVLGGKLIEDVWKLPDKKESDRYAKGWRSGESPPDDLIQNPSPGLARFLDNLRLRAKRGESTDDREKDRLKRLAIDVYYFVRDAGPRGIRASIVEGRFCGRQTDKPIPRSKLRRWLKMYEELGLFDRKSDKVPTSRSKPDHLMEAVFYRATIHRMEIERGEALGDDPARGQVRGGRYYGSTRKMYEMSIYRDGKRVTQYMAPWTYQEVSQLERMFSGDLDELPIRGGSYKDVSIALLVVSRKLRIAEGMLADRGVVIPRGMIRREYDKTYGDHPDPLEAVFSKSEPAQP
ncbi:MAG: hypothetical protein WCK39_02035 [Methanomassiliicoccales archaeon]